MTDKIYNGHIIRMKPQNNFGFIEADNFEEIFFYLDCKRNDLIDNYYDKHKFQLGDEVEFKLRKSKIDDHKFEAFELKFIKNRRIELLLEEFKNNKKLKGYLKMIDVNQFYIKHDSTYIFIKLTNILKSETNIQENYYNKINSLVEFELLNINKIHKIKAVLLNRVFKEINETILDIIESKKTILAIITGRNSKGYHVVILNNSIKSFIHINKEMLEQTNFKKGEKVNVIIKKTSISYKLELIS